MSIAPLTNIPCSLESLNANEPMAGTAPKAQVWFMLEYTPRWGHKAWEESSIDPAVRAAVDEQLKQIPGARLLLIRQKDRAATLRFFAAVLGDEPRLYKFELDNYEELPVLDLVSIVAGAEQYQASLTDEQVLLVCTNGQRDACCVLHGVAVYNTLHGQLGHTVWESSHHGGHRFAANLLAFPSGRSYGRLGASNALGIVQRIVDGEVPAQYCRGYTAWAEPAQAAELLLRQQLGLQQEGGLRLLDSQPAGEARWRVRFEGADGERELTVERVEGAPVHASCGDEKTTPTVEYRVVDSSADEHDKSI
ncbi:MAG: hypothetical protein KF701_07710 [Anaerolineales bacterium]|nr:MAG: hypothetical protein KF701_07710 [Anaerolineales bacterium]